MTYVVKCIWRATSLKLAIQADSEDEALEKASRHSIGRKALSWVVTAVRP
jgi:hypothetical protein